MSKKCSLKMSLFIAIILLVSILIISDNLVSAATAIYECETLSNTTSGPATSVTASTYASGGNYLNFTSIAVNDWIQFTINVAAADTYTVEVGYKGKNTRGIVQLYIDGVARGSAFDQYYNTTDNNTFLSANCGSISLTAGNHTFKFQVTGKNANSTSYNTTFDYIKLTGTGGATPTPTATATTIPTPTPTATLTPTSGSSIKYECENLTNTTSGPGTSTAASTYASAGNYLNFTSTAVNDWIQFTVNVAADTYTVEVGYKGKNTRGTVQLYVDGVIQGSPIDEYYNTTGDTTFLPANCGSVTLSAGNHTFKFQVTGRNTNSTSYNTTFDYITLTGTGTVTPTPTPLGTPRTFNVKTDFGAKGDGTTDDTSAINSAISAANSAGGGTVLFPSGTYSSKSIHLKSNVYLYIDSGAVIQARSGIDAAESNSYSSYQDYGHSHFRDALIWGENLNNIKITGKGTIDGNNILTSSDTVPSGQGDKAISLKLCANVEIGGFDINNKLTMKLGGHFAALTTGCDYLNIHDVYVPNNSNNQRDIIDVMQCNEVTVKNITVDFCKDDIVKLGSDCSLGYIRPMKNVTVDNIKGYTWCNVFQIGSETAGNISNVHVSNLTVTGAGKAGFGISCNDGAIIDGVTLDGVNPMTGTTSPFFIELSNRLRALGSPTIGKIQNVIISNVTATNCTGYRGEFTATIAGIKTNSTTAYVENIAFNNVKITAIGSHAYADASITPPELTPGQYNVGDLGVRPAYGWYLRHVKGIHFHNSCSVGFDSNDDRYAMVVDDADDIEFDGFTMAKGSGINYRVELLNTVNNFYMHGCPNLPTVGPANFSSAKY